jgi:hypothetical protein
VPEIGLDTETCSVMCVLLFDGAATASSQLSATQASYYVPGEPATGS